MKKNLRDILKGRVVIVGVGNILRGDDAFGPALIESLQGLTRAVLIDAGTAPESYAGLIIKSQPDVVLFADAVHLGFKPGDYDVLAGDEIVKSGLTTHDLSPRMLIEYLSGQTQAPIYLLGVQPKNIALGDEMSEEVNKTLGDLTQEIVQCMKRT